MQLFKNFFTLVLLFTNIITFGQDVVENVVWVKVKPEYADKCLSNSINIEELQPVLRMLETEHLKQKFPQAKSTREKPLKYDLSGIYEIKFNAQISVEHAVKMLSKFKCFQYVEPYYFAHPMYIPNDVQADSVSGAQYSLKMHKVYDAWDISKSNSNILIGISDSGIDFEHEDLKDRHYKNMNDTIDGIDNDGDGYIDNYNGWNFAENNNDASDAGNHGTAVVGNCSATPDNSIAMAGVGFDAQYVSLRIYNPSYTKFAGYESIVYAADKGYDVLNMSWGCKNCYSGIAEDIINYAVIDNDVVLVAAAGNENNDVAYYPASYDNVLSVAGLEPDFVKVGYQTFNENVDISALGNSIYTTFPGNSYNFTGGSSHASPIVAGAAAILKSHFPNYSAIQIGQQLRVTADTSIYNLAGNLSYKNKLGKGSLDLHKALTDTLSPSIRNIRNYADAPLTSRGDTLEITGEFVNYLRSTQNLTITLSCNSSYITLLDSVVNVGVLNSMDTFINTIPFKLIIANNTPFNRVINLKFTYSDGAYKDVQLLSTIVNQDYIHVRENNIAFTVNSGGNIGYNVPNRFQGIGLLYDDADESILYEAGLMIATNDSTVSNNIRTFGSGIDREFFLIEPMRESDAGTFSDFKATAIFRDTINTMEGQNVGVLVTNNIYAWTSAENENFFITEYVIENRNNYELNNVYAGIFADWDIASNHIDITAWDDSSGTGYVAEKVSTGKPIAGIKPLSPYCANYYAIDNDHTHANNPLGIYNGFTDWKKFATLSSGFIKTEAGYLTPTGDNNYQDVSHTIAGNIGNLQPNESKTIAFAFVVGYSMDELRASAINAQLKYNEKFTLGSAPIFNEDITICAGTSADINPSGNASYVLFPSLYSNRILSEGSTLQTPIIEDTTNFYIAFSDTCLISERSKITVNTYRPEISFDIDPDTLFLKDRNYIYTYNTSPHYVSWKWNLAGIETGAYNPSISFKDEGVYEIKLNITDSNDCPNALSKFLVAYDSTLNSLHSDINSKIEIFPNPSNGKFIVNAQVKIQSISIQNMTGQAVANIVVNGYSTNINFEHIPKGIYILHLTTENGNGIFYKLVIE